MSFRSVSSFVPKLAFLASMFALACIPAHAQTPLVQVPIVTNILGIPTATYNSATPGTPCTNGLNSTTGDGCPGNQTLLNYPYGVAVDAAGDVVVAGAGGTSGLTVVYQGGAAMAAVITAAKSNIPAFTPIVGHAYLLITGTANLTSTTGVGPYYCNNSPTGTVALDKYANGCPAAYANFTSRAVTLDPDGNLFFSEYSPNTSVRVIYSGGVRAANLIKAYNPTVTTPQVGYIYALSTPGNGDFVSIRGIAVQVVSPTTENVYVSDNGTSATASGEDAATEGNQIKIFVCPTGGTGCNTNNYSSVITTNKSTAAGWVTFIPGTVTSGPTTANGDGAVASAAVVDGPTCLETDPYGNLYIADTGDLRIRVVYAGGSTPPLYIEGNNTVKVAPVVGDIYTVVGGASTSTTPQSPAAAYLISTAATNFGLDAAGNLYFTRSATSLWEENAVTGQAVDVGWSGATTATGTAIANPVPGAFCNGGTSGPTMTDAYGDGCPVTQVITETPNFSQIAFDSAGNYYLIDARSASTNGPVSVVHKYTFGNQLGPVPVGTSVTTTFAFTPSVNQATKTYTPTPSFSSPEYTDAGGDVCTTTTGGYATQTCVYNITFKPTRAGSRPGTLTLNQTGIGVLDAVVLGGIGTGSQLALDPSSQSTLGTGLAPAGVALDAAGNTYIADTTSGSVFKSTAGAAPVAFATGLKTPAQIAVNGAGTLFVADKGNNRIATASVAGGAVTSFLASPFTLETPGFPATSNAAATLTNPAGVALDLAGNVYVADTGNNRIIEIVIPQGGSASSNVLLGFTGLSAPQGLAVDASGDVFVADTGNARIVELSAAGVQTTVASSPALTTPVGVAVDAAGNLYLVDSGNQSVILVAPGATSGTTLLGNVTGLGGVAVDTVGDIFFAASASGGVIELNRSAIAVTYPLTNVGSTSPQNLTLNSTGNVALTTGASLATNSETTDFSTVPATTNGCSTNQSVAPGASCNVSAVFQPQTVGKFTDMVTFPASSAVNAPVAALTGTGAKEVPTTAVLSYATNPPVTPAGGLPIAGQPFTVTDTINLSSNAGTPTGSVTFTVDGTPQKPVNISAGATTSASTSLTLSAGSHTVTAVYSGDSNYAGSSATISFMVVAAQTSKLALSYALGAPGAGGTVNTALTATLSAPSTAAAFTGTVTFTVDGVAQAPVTVSATGSASINVPLAAGSHTVTATYSGTSYYSSSSSSQTFVVVTGTSTISLAVSPTGSVTFGTAVTVTATIVTGNSTAPPTGSIIFTLNGVAQPPVPYAASAAVAFTMPTPGKYTVSASYTGDSNYAPASATGVAFTVLQSPSTTALVSNVNVVANGNTLTLTATIGPSFGKVFPTGTVTFSNAGVVLGTGSVSTASSPGGVAGIATFTTTSSALASYTFTAAYGGDANYLPSNAALNPTGTFAVSALTTSLTLPQNSVVSDTLDVTSVYNYSGSVKYSCTNLPANTTCDFSPVPTLFSATATPSNVNTTQTVQLQVFTSTTPLATAALAQKPLQRGWLPAVSLAFSLCLGFSWKRRRQLSRLVLSMVFFTLVLGLAGCSSDTTDHNVYPTPTGTYTIGITATDGTITTTTNITVTVIAGPSSARPS